MGTRAATHVCDLDPEQVFSVLNGDFDTDKKRLYLYDVNQVHELPRIDHGAARQDLGEHTPGQGLAYTIGDLSGTSAMLGLGQAYTETQAVPDGQCIALGMLFGVDPQATGRRSTGSTAAAGATSLVVTEADSGNHAVGQLVAIEMPSGEYIVRPCTGYAAGEMTFSHEFPEVPAENAVVAGGVSIEWDDGDSGALPTATAELIGLSAADHVRHRGAIPASLSIAEKGPNEVPEMAWKWRVADFDDLFSKSRTLSVVPLPYVTGGGEYLLGARGETTYTLLRRARVGIEINGGIDALEDICSDIGLSGWDRYDDHQIRVTITIPDDQEFPADLLSTATTGRGSWRAGRSSTGMADRFFAQFTWGRRILGRLVSFYFPDLVMVEPPARATVSKARAFKYTFAPLSGGDSPRMRALIS